MTEPFVVEVWGKPAGVVLREGNAFRFRAIAQPFFVLDGAQFTTLGHARLAVARLEFDRGHDPGDQGGADHNREGERSLGRASH